MMECKSNAGPGPPHERPPDPGGDPEQQTSRETNGTHSTDKAAQPKHTKNTNGAERKQDEKQDAATSSLNIGDIASAEVVGAIKPRVEGWDPAVTNRIKETMAKTWSTPLGHVMSGDLKRLFAIATAIYPLHDDAHLREMTTDETQAFTAYMKGDLDLPAPPTFLTCTTTTLKRAGMLAYHQRHVEVTLIANVGSNLQVGKYLKKKSILRELHTANGSTTQGSLMMKRLITNALRISFDGLNTMSFVFPSKRIAKPWEGAALKFRTGALVLESATTTQVGIKPPPQIAQHYAMNVIGVANMDPFTILTVFNGITGNRVIDIRQRGLDGLNEDDNDYWTVICSNLDCPPALRGVTCIVVQDVELIVHHFKREPLAPCMRCLNPKHHHSRCKVSPQKLPSVRANRQRKFTGEIPAPIQLTPRDYENTEFLNGPPEQFKHQDYEMSTGLEPHIPLETVTVEVTQKAVDAQIPVQPSAVVATQTLLASTDDGYRVQRRTKKKTKPVSRLTDGIQQISNPNPIDTNTSSTSTPTHGNQPPASRKQPRTKSNKKMRYKTFAQLAASERYQQTRDAYALLDADDGASDEDADTQPVVDLVQSIPECEVDIYRTTLLNGETDDGMEPSLHTDLTDVELRDTTGELLPEQGREHTDTSEVEESNDVDFQRNTEVHSLLPAQSDGSPGPDANVTKALTEWMATHGGHQVAVPDNGQSLYTAFFTSTSNPSHDRVTLDDEDIATLNVIKKNVLNVVLAKLRYDIQLELLQPQKELLRMYPATKVPSTTAGATAKLYAHFAADRFVSTSSHISTRARAPVLELRAMAVYSREPIYVWTMGDTGVIRVDQYTTHSYKMQNGDIHETGIAVEFSPESACKLLSECANAHVAPIMLMLTEDSSLFTGVSLSSTFTQWDSQPGASMRNRLDEVQTTLGYAHIDGAPIDYSSLAEDAAVEEQFIWEELGVDVYASGCSGCRVFQPGPPPAVLEMTVEVITDTRSHNRYTSKYITDTQLCRTARHWVCMFFRSGCQL